MNLNGAPSPQETPDPLDATEAEDPVLPPPFGRNDRINGVYVFFILMLAGMIVVGGVLQLLFGFVVNAITTEIVVILLPVLMLLRKRDPFRKLNLAAPPALRALLWGVLGVLGLAIILAQFGYWSEQIFPMPRVFKEAYLAAITPHSFVELVVFVFAAGVIPGICEEIAFRGYFQPVFKHRYGTTAGILIAAALFAIMHMDPWHFVALFVIGAYLGYLYHWTGSLWVPITAHFANNAASVIIVYSSPDVALSQMDEAPPAPLLLVAVVVFVLSILWLRRNAIRATIPAT